jgi:hypothetical protein
MSTQQAPAQQAKRLPTDFSKLETVTLSYKRPAKWYMYVVKSTLKEKASVEIRARPSGAAQVVRVAEALKRLGYISYEKYYTTSVVQENNLLRYIVVRVKKTDNFDKLFKEREEERSKRLEAEAKPKQN